MNKSRVVAASLAVALAMAGGARAGTFEFSFAGPGVSGDIKLTYGTGTDAIYPQASEVTGIGGVFSDSSHGISNEAISTLLPITHATPECGNMLAPSDFSRFGVGAAPSGCNIPPGTIAGLPADGNGYITYDNLLWTGGSVPTATDYQGYGGFLDIYGVAFTLANGDVVDVWSNGEFLNVPGGPTIVLGDAPDYGVAVVNGAGTKAIDYVTGGVQVPEPGSMAVLGTGLLGLFGGRRVLAGAD